MTPGFPSYFLVPFYKQTVPSRKRLMILELKKYVNNSVNPTDYKYWRAQDIRQGL